MIDNTKDISRGKANPISKIAFERGKESRVNDRNIVMGLLDGSRCTLEIAEIMGKPLHRISGRFSGLKAKNLIYQSSRKEYKGSKYSVYSKVGNPIQLELF